MKEFIVLITAFITTVLIVAVSSSISSHLWQGKPEVLPDTVEINIIFDETVREFGLKNKLSDSSLKSIFDLKSKSDLDLRLESFGITKEEIRSRTEKKQVIEAESSSKNWFKIPLKFSLWLIMLIVMFVLIVKKKINRKVRITFYGISVILFGIILGADPSPMGTVKDAIVLYGTKGVIFPPRMIAFSLFMIMVILANKFICSWGCQFGTLQDFLFRLNRKNKDTSSIIRQYKVPFIISNSIRIMFFTVFTAAAFIWNTDLVEKIDPFKIFKPFSSSVAGIVFITLILIMSLFIYRPWCHFFCPFGLAGWLGEKISIFKIKVNYDTCISCNACSKACPSTVMGIILKRDKIIPDCYSCSSCINVCPTGSISFSSGRRVKPPADKFNIKPVLLIRSLSKHQ